MSWDILKKSVENAINTNGNRAITGQTLQNVLINIISEVGKNSTFAGIATPETNPGVFDGPIFYIATTAGIYINFDNTQVSEDEVVVLEWDTISWNKKVLEVVSKTKFSQLENDVEAVKKATIKNKGFFSSVESLNNAYPSASFGDIAYVGFSSPYAVWTWDGNNWVDSAKKEEGIEVPLNEYYTKRELDKKENGEQLNLSNYVDRNCSLGSTSWYMDPSTKKQRHKAIPTSGKKFIDITVSEGAAAFIGFVTSAYSTPTSETPIPYCASTNYRIRQEAKTSVQYSIPSDCAYIILTTVDGSGLIVNYGDVNLYSSSSSCPERLENLENSVENLTYKCQEADNNIKKIEFTLNSEGGDIFDVDLSTFVERNCSLGSTSWYMNPSTGLQRHKAIPVNGMRLLHISTGPATAYIGFVTSAYSTPKSEDPIPYCASTNYRITQLGNTVKDYAIPSDCAYIILTTVDGGGITVEYENIVLSENISVVEKINELVTGIKKIEFTLNSEGGEFLNIDLSTFVEQNCSLGTKGWYMNPSTGLQRHKAIPVNGMKLLHISTGSATAYIGFVTSAYNPPYISEDAVPYCYTATGRITQLGNTTKEYTIPSDCAYIILTTVDGGDITVEYKNIVLSENISITDKLKELEAAVGNGMGENSNGVSRIKVMSWNIGHYCNGTGVNTAITNENYIQKRTEYRELFNKYAVDFLGLVEYSDVFNESTGESAESAIISQYKNRVFGGITVGGYVCNGLASVVKPTLKGFINFDLEYYAADFEVKYMGSKFRLCVAHLPWQSEEYNLNAINKLITYYGTTQKVIIVGDFNVRADYYYDMFLGAGYELANHGYMGDIVTYPKESPSHILDNILVKGGQILSTEVIQSDLSDHYPIISEIVI